MSTAWQGCAGRSKFRRKERLIVGAFHDLSGKFPHITLREPWMSAKVRQKRGRACEMDLTHLRRT